MRKTGLVVGTWLAGFALWGTLLAIVPVLGQVGSDLDLVHSETGLVFSVPILALALVAPFGGTTADKIGPRKTGVVGLALVGIGGLLRGLPSGLPSLLAYSAIFGVGWGLCLPTLPKIVGGWFENKAAGTVTGIYSTGIYIGAGLATALTFSNSWRTSLVIWGWYHFRRCGYLVGPG